MDYQSLINSSALTIFVAVVLLLVTTVCVIYLRNGWNEAKRLGVTTAEMKKIVLNCIGISLVPSIPIVLSVIVMAPVLGDDGCFRNRRGIYYDRYDAAGMD